MSVIYVVPSRGRPQNVSSLIDAFRDTRAHAHLHVALDRDDPLLHNYVAVFKRHGSLPWLRYSVRTRRVAEDGMVATFNAAVAALLGDKLIADEKLSGIGFMGDDHRPRTAQWDSHLLHEIVNGRLLTYGNDLLQGALLPTAVLMRADVPRVLGYAVPPTIRHLYVDNVWLTWGRRLNAISYRDDVILEHMHPQIYKADWDERYDAVNGGEMWARDEKAYHTYLADDLDTDLAKLRKLL